MVKITSKKQINLWAIKVSREIRKVRTRGEKPAVKVIAMKTVEDSGITNKSNVRALAKEICINLSNRSAEKRAAIKARNEYQKSYAVELARRYP